MQKETSNKLSLLAFALLILFNFSCSKEDINLNELDETFFVRHKNADMPAHVHGNGSEKVFLIVLHGGPGSGVLGYRVNSIRTEIERNNAVVYFDQRGSGSSQGNYAEDDVSIDLMAEDVLALAKTIRAKFGDDSKLFLMGHSWGGTLGPAVLLQNQNEFRGWIDVNGAHNHADLYKEYQIVLTQSANDQIALGNSVDYWQDVLDVVQNIDTNFTVDNHLRLNGLANTVDRVLARDKIINEPILDLGDKPQRSNGLLDRWNMSQIGRILDYQEGLNEVSFADRLSEITIPSFVLWGRHDHSVPLKFAHEAFDNLGATDKELFIFERSGHSPFNTEPNLFSTKVIEFVNKHK